MELQLSLHHKHQYKPHAGFLFQKQPAWVMPSSLQPTESSDVQRKQETSSPVDFPNLLAQNMPSSYSGLTSLRWLPLCCSFKSERREKENICPLSLSLLQASTQRHNDKKSLVHSFLPSLADYLKVLLPFSLSFSFLLCLYFLFPLPLPGRETTKKL